MMTKTRYSVAIKDKAKALGFEEVGISKAEFLGEDRRRLEAWLLKGYHGSMGYMEKHIEERSNPKVLMPGAKSVIVLRVNYYPPKIVERVKGKVSKYAYGEDYHRVIKDKLVELLNFMREMVGDIQGRGFVDSAPVFEKAWGVRSGLGWVGKNGNLIDKKRGSFFFLCTLIVDVELDYDEGWVGDFCGTCNRCVEGCPTGAILPNKEINAKQCISYYTIELKAHLKEKVKDFDSGGWLFGCDVCQDVCPWNRFAKPHEEKRFEVYEEILNFEIKDWLNLNEAEFNKLFKFSALKRTKYKGIVENVRLIEEKY